MRRSLPLLVVLVVSCEAAPPRSVELPEPAPAPSAEAPAPVVLPACARRAPQGIARVDETGTGSAIVLARAGSRTIALAADEDSAAVHAIDLDTRAVLSTTVLGGRPSQVVITPDGRVVAALRDRHALEVLEPVGAAFERRCLVETAAEPAGLAVAKDGTVLVASRWGRTLQAFAGADFAPRFTVDLARDPAAVAISADGAKAVVTHAVGGGVSIVNLGKLEKPDAPRWIRGNAGGRSYAKDHMLRQEERTAQQGFAITRTASGRMLAPVVISEPHPSQSVRRMYGGISLDKPTVSSDVAVIDPETERVSLSRPARLGATDCLLPRGAAIDEARGELLVACLGRDEIVVYDARADLPHARIVRKARVASGPRGVAVDAAGKRAAVWSQFDGVVSVLPLGGGEVEAIAVAAHRALPAELDRGRKLFHEAGGRRIAGDGRACASCHPDGRDDGLSWLSLQGLQQTPMLLKRLPDTAPYGWGGGESSLALHFETTLWRLGGSGLPAKDRDALFAWIQSLEPPGEPPPPADARVARGEAVFYDRRVGCSSCHFGSDTTDRTRHDVKTAITHWSTGFDTPSLRFLTRSAPYLHDGRYSTLGELLDGTDGKMGHTKHLSREDREALVVYLESL